ncbi:7-cyano-7-deazaguanine synthase QueC [Oxalobacter vibrioformis]|uniref:7-cyano-7-deazaguanine synthase n=1 Tax=Oxalobacter vibrioformis TaxID=933080 RepID=A0A9E9M2B7_9BURK|nr:7-cyano-7-deazaguanine synthase QueC [Oxalobacter vibrioformis]WAW11183.1 7-cyano-7-deazaguanine synthase QueC [Oxalobacter vibrioformis]
MSSLNHALVLFSGGQDSTTCLAWALAHYTHVETIGFDYGQRHHIELAMRPTILSRLRTLSDDWNNRLGMDHVIDLSLIASLSDTAMTTETEIRFMENGLPNTFVPGRNLLFMMVAATLGYRRNLDILVGGMCETDSSGYPDCRDDTMKALQLTLNLGMAGQFRVETPLMWKDKAQTWQLAKNIGGTALVDLIREETHTCYLGERGTLHDWGHGCGACPACELRKRGYRIFSGNPASG